MSYILEGLYLGGLEDAHNTQQLKKNGITHILTVEHRPLPMAVIADFSSMYIHALDMATEDLLVKFDASCKFIEEGRDKGGVLIHCFCGVSRSATLALAYVMWKMSLSLEEAISLVQKHRPQIGPNRGFKMQLQLFETMGNRIEESHEQYKSYKLEQLALKMQSAQLGETLLDGALSADPSEYTPQDGVVYKCKKCRRNLFQATGVMIHNVGRGEAAFDWRSQLGNDETEDDKTGGVTPCTHSLFICPVQWMAETVLTLSGKILCPKCHAKLGSFNWAGEQCNCGTWITPAFHIQPSKVDKCQIIARREGASNLPTRMLTASQKQTNTMLATKQSCSLVDSVGVHI